VIFTTVREYTDAEVRAYLEREVKLLRSQVATLRAALQKIAQKEPRGMVNSWEQDVAIDVLEATKEGAHAGGEPDRAPGAIAGSVPEKGC